MPRFSEETLVNWTNPPSDTEEEKLSNAERMVKEAINQSVVLTSKNIEIFGQGSYANDTNVRLNSDIDINVRYIDGFYFGLPEGKTRSDFGLNSPDDYSLDMFKNDVHLALIEKFGAESVKRKNKCITVLGNSYRVETDVVPTWNHRRYSDDGAFVVGAKLKTDSGEEIVNYPKQHITNGIKKNSETSRRFKRLTRIYRKLRYKMIEDGHFVSDSVTSFLLECLVWNVPNTIFNDYITWQDRLKYSILHLYEHTKDESKSDQWGEVSELLYLFRGKRKWTRNDVNKFLSDLWIYLGY